MVSLLDDGSRDDSQLEGAEKAAVGPHPGEFADMPVCEFWVPQKSPIGANLYFCPKCRDYNFFSTLSVDGLCSPMLLFSLLPSIVMLPTESIQAYKKEREKEKKEN